MNTEPHPPNSALVGIDLGTTFSVLATLDEHGRPRTISNARGELLTPSAVFFDDEGVIVGREAYYASTLDPHRFADCFKRDMGRLRFHRKIGGFDLPPEVLSGFVIRELTQEAIQQLGSVEKGVITVPAFFDATRRQATQDAGRLAGLDVLDIINEPTAAAVAIGYQQGFLNPSQPRFGIERQRMLVYDLGGGTFDVTIMDVHKGEFRTLATDGDVQLGGKDFDERLVDQIAEKFYETHGLDPRSEPHDAAQLWLDAQEAKHSLTSRHRTRTVCSYAGVSVQLELKREEFERMTSDLLYRTESTMQQVLRDAALKWTDVDRVILVGGSTRMPMVSKMIQQVTGKEPDRSASPDEAVAHGAALYAGMLVSTGRTDGTASSPHLVNVNSHSLGVAGIDVATRTRVNQIVIPRNTPLPTRTQKKFVTDRDGQRTVRVRVMEGESRRPDDCVSLGECIIQGLPEGLPSGTPVEVEFSYEPNGRLYVSARIPSIRQSAQVKIDRHESQMLEPLQVWTMRLRNSADSELEANLIPAENEQGEPEPGASSTREGVDFADPASVLSRFDSLVTQVGTAAMHVPLPATLAPFREAAEQSRRLAEQARIKWHEAEREKRRAAGGSEAVRTGAALAKAKTEYAQRQNQLKFSLLILGRECVNRKALQVLPPPVQSLKDEIEELKARLNS